jgi:uncharacterized protein
MIRRAMPAPDSHRSLTTVATDANVTPEPEWPATLDVEGMMALGWRPVPFREFVLKIHSRCDLACDYCYMYTMADQSWRIQPLEMSHTVVDQAAMRIAEHVETHRLPSVKLILHGGEPLLVGPELITYAVTAVRTAVGSSGRVDVVVQTNGLRLDATYLDLFAALGVRVGISLDGNATAHDRHRRHANGRGSYIDVKAALEGLALHSNYRQLFGGLLSTIDVRNDPVTTYEALLEFSPPMIDFLLPHGNWTTPPAYRTPGAADTPYGDWLIAVFDRWYRAPRRETRIRLFGEIMRTLLGAASRTEAIGLSPVTVIVIQTDGEIEQSDTLKSTFTGAPFTGLHVARDSFDLALLRPAIAARQIGERALSAACQTCKILRICGGGHYAHRYRAGTGFSNPSVYCPDLLRLIMHIRSTIQADINSLGERHV